MGSKMGEAKFFNEIRSEILENPKKGKISPIDIKQQFPFFSIDENKIFPDALFAENSKNTIDFKRNIAYFNSGWESSGSKDSETMVKGFEAFANGVDILGNRCSNSTIDQMVLTGISLIIKSLKRTNFKSNFENKRGNKQGG